MVDPSEYPDSTPDETVSPRHHVSMLLALLCLQVAIIFYRTRRCSIFCDDFLNFEIYREMGWGWHYILRDLQGQMAPAFRIVMAVFFKLFGINYKAAVAIMAAASILTTTLIYLTMRRLKCAEWTIFSGLIVFVFLLQYSATQFWWSAATNTLFSTTSIVCAIFCVVGPDGKGPLWRNTILTALWFTVALMFTGGAVCAIIILASIFLYATYRDTWLRTLRQGILKLIVMAAPILFYVWLAFRFSPTPAGPVPSHNILGILNFTWYLITDSIVAGMFGLGTHGIALPEPLALVISFGVLAIIAGWAIYRDPRTWIVWAGAVGYILTSSLLISIERSAVFPGMAFKLRYGVEGTTVLIMAIILSLSKMRFSEIGRSAVLIGAVAIALNLQIQSQKLQIEPGEDSTRVYVDNLRHSLVMLRTLPNVIILDGISPAMPLWMEHYRPYSMFLPLFTRKYLITPDKTLATYYIGDDGNVHPLTK
jgi:hypothetical protein